MESHSSLAYFEYIFLLLNHLIERNWTIWMEAIKQLYIRTCFLFRLWSILFSKVWISFNLKCLVTSWGSFVPWSWCRNAPEQSSRNSSGLWKASLISLLILAPTDFYRRDVETSCTMKKEKDQLLSCALQMLECPKLCTCFWFYLIYRSVAELDQLPK